MMSVIGSVLRARPPRWQVIPASIRTASRLFNSQQISSQTSLQSEGSTAANGKAASAGCKFLTSGPALIKKLRSRQVAYRLRVCKDKNPKIRAADKELGKREIRWLVEHVCGTDSSATTHLSRAMRRDLIHGALQMTRQDVPLAYVVGNMPFGSLPKPVIVRKPLLIPRQETEFWATKVANAILARLQNLGDYKGTLRIADLCTGTGCIALLVANALRSSIGEGGWTVVACDRSLEAVQVAIQNRVNMGFAEHQVRVVQADIFNDADMEALCNRAGGPFDVILSNPPYIPRRDWQKLAPSVRLHEDPIALIGEQDAEQLIAQKDADGLAFHRRLAELAFSPSFSTLTASGKKATSPVLPRLIVAEYGKGQNALVHRMYDSHISPTERLPTIVKLPHQLFICGLGNPKSLALTRHSVGRVALDPLHEQLVAIDQRERQRLAHLQQKCLLRQADRLNEAFKQTFQKSGGNTTNSPALPLVRVTPAQQPPAGQKFSLVEHEYETTFDPETDYDPTITRVSRGRRTSHPHHFTPLVPTIEGQEGSLSAVIPMLVPSSTDRSVVYQIDVVLFKPASYMNLSGIALRALVDQQVGAKQALAALDNILVMHDELDMEFGEVSRRDKGSARGHNGIRDIFVRFKLQHGSGNQPLTRIRIGIGRSPWYDKDAVKTKNQARSKKEGKMERKIDVSDWVLSPLTSAELSSVREMADHSVLAKIADNAHHWIRERVKQLAPDLEILRQQPTYPKRLSIANQKDQYGVDRFIWLER